MTDVQAMAATPHADLIAELMNPNNPKNEREHAAVREIERLQEALAQTAQAPVAWSSYEYDGIHHKPVAWMDADGNVSDNNDHKCFPIPLYTITYPNPPQRTWVGLTEEEIQAVAKQARSKEHSVTLTNKLLKEKNT